MAGLLSLATAVPPHELRTEDVIREATGIFAGRHKDFERLMPVFGNSGIERRFSVQPYEWFRGDKGWPERTAAFIEGASLLFAKVSSLALAQAGLTAAEIDSIVMVSSTGVATPSIEARMLSELGFRHRRAARAGLRPRLCGRRLRPVAGGTAGQGRAGFEGAAGGDRTLHAGVPA